MTTDQEKLSQRYRAWVVTLAKEMQLDGVATARLAEAVERQAHVLHAAHERLRDPVWEERMMAVMTRHLFVAFHGGPMLDQLLDPIVGEATTEFRHSVRAAFAAEMDSFGDSRPEIQSFLDRAFPIGDTGGEDKRSGPLPCHSALDAESISIDS